MNDLMSEAVKSDAVSKATTLPDQSAIIALLDTDDAAYIDAHINEIQAVWSKRQIFRTETEMRISVLNDTKFPTQAAKYWQAVRELSVFYQNLITLSFEYRRNGVKQKKVEKKFEVEISPLDKELLGIDLEELKFSQLNMQMTARDRMREIKLWLQMMAECVEADPGFDTENVDTHQLESYVMRFQNESKHITAHTAKDERINLDGQFKTAMRYLNGAGLPEKQG